MHRISELEIKNFRSCKNTKIKLEKFTPLVGYNNAGKSKEGANKHPPQRN
ncbi:AAA family ATPase [Aeromonas veronii]